MRNINMHLGDAYLDANGKENRSMKRILFVSLICLYIACQPEAVNPTGFYELKVFFDDNEQSGELEIVGEPEDYFGKLTINAKRKRVYAVGLTHASRDSLAFFLPGKGGFLRLSSKGSTWEGKFKYFGLKAEVVAEKKGPPSEELQALVSLKPLGQGVISTGAEESFPVYDQYDSCLYFSRDNTLFSSQQRGDGSWAAPDTLPFSSGKDAAPYLSPDGRSLLFSSSRSLTTSPSKKNLWLVSKEAGAWTEPIKLPPPINVDTLGDYHGGITAAQHIYFISYNRTGGYGRSDIYKATQALDGTYQVENLGPAINTSNSEADVYIDPQETYLLFASTDREDSYGADDIYISYRVEEKWQSPQNVGPVVNSFAYEYGAWVDEKGGYLYFNSFRRGSSDIYRVPLPTIEAIK
ncbi:MAG: hypothetical protein AAFR61_12870 [Bacteroidota bacterium]